MWTVMVAATYENASLKFSTEAEAQLWAQRYADAFPNHKVWLVQGEARQIKKVE